MAMVPIHRGLAWRIGGRLNSESAAYPAEHAANHAADDAPKGSCCLGSDSGAMRGAVGDALCLRRKRASKCCGDYARVQNMKLHATTLSLYD